MKSVGLVAVKSKKGRVKDKITGELGIEFYLPPQKDPETHTEDVHEVFIPFDNSNYQSIVLNAAEHCYIHYTEILDCEEMDIDGVGCFFINPNRVMAKCEKDGTLITALGDWVIMEPIKKEKNVILNPFDVDKVNNWATLISTQVPHLKQFIGHYVGFHYSAQFLNKMGKKEYWVTDSDAILAYQLKEENTV
jgi:hypothetical protein